MFNNQDASHLAKPTLPSDSWHHQMQLQETAKQHNDGNKNQDLDLSTFKTEKCTSRAKHNPKH